MTRLTPWLLALTLALAPAALAQSHPTGDKSTFAAEVKRHYAKWVKGRPDGKLTADRVNQLVNDPRVTGDEAAAVAAAHLRFRVKNPPAALDQAALLARPAAPAPGQRPDERPAVVDCEAEYARFRAHLRTVPRGLFERDAPHRTGIHQGNLGDCFVVAALGEIATKHPTRFKETVKEEKDGSYTVTFPGKVAVTVPKLTDAQIALGSSAGGQGVWVNVFEQAVALHLRKSGGPAVAIDVISDGGNTAGTLELLTHHRIEVVRLRHEGAKREAVLAALRKQLADTQEHRRLVCASSGTGGKYPPGIITHHAYAVVGFDEKADTITLWNPWGNTFEPKGGAGLIHGYPTKSGKFTMPLTEFEQVFQAAFVETTAKPDGK